MLLEQRLRTRRPTLPKAPARWPRRRLDPERYAGDRDLLANIQGNILRSHGRDRALLVFFCFGPRDCENRAALRAAAALVTSGERQRAESRAYRQARAAGRLADPTTFYSLALTAEGLGACGIRDLPAGVGRPAAAFAAGMAGDRKLLGDPPVEEWDDTFQRPIHGVWQLAADGDAALLDALELVREWVQSCAGRLAGVEPCFHWRPDPKARWTCREPFGFADGISNPNFFGDLPPNHWSVDIGLDRILIEEAGPHHGGSFLVMRKLDQNVAAFRAFEAQLTAALRETAADDTAAGGARELAESVIIGRNRAGVPLAQLHGDGLNDFSFRSDDRAARCPFHAHIRKANPRDDNPYAEAIAMEDARNIQFVRRGMVYGDLARLTLEGPDWPTGDVGLWFIGYMRDIEEQFREMQARWFRDRNFPASNGDPLPDPLLFGGGEKSQTWKWARDGRTTCVPGLAQFVRMRGGEYFYVPTIQWLGEVMDRHAKEASAA